MKKTLLISILLVSNFVFAADYYVATTGNDANNGSQASPWRTIQKACSNVPANAGHIINLGQGTFSETATSNIPSGVTIKGAGRNLTVITSSVYPIFNVTNGANIVLCSFTLDGRKKALWQAINMTEVNGLDFYDFNVKEFGYWTNVEPYVYISTFAFKKGSNIKIHDFEGTNASSGHNAMIGLGSGAMTDVEIFNGNIVNSEDSHGKIVGAGGASTPLNNLKIHDNTFLTASVGGWAIPGTSNYPPQIVIELWDGILSNCEIYNNTLNACVSIQSNGHAYPSDTYKTLRIHHNKWNCDRNVGYQYAMETSNDNNEIDHNYIYGGAYAIASFGEWGAKPLKNINIHHNVFEAQSISTLIVNITANVQNVRFANNTVSCSSGNGMFGFGGSVQNTSIVNNIFYRQSGSSDNVGSSATISNNLFFNINSKGSAAISSNPQLLGTGVKPTEFFALQATSPAINVGVQIAGVTDGFVGSAPDLGAFEFGQAPWSVGNGASVGGSTAFNIPSTIEAEKANFVGGTKSNNDHLGYSGTGFVDGFQTVGAKVSFNLNAAADADFIVKLTFANGNPTSTSLSMYVDGVKIKQIALAGLNSWDAWSSRTDTLKFKKGINKLEFVFDAADGGHVNLDKIEVSKILPVFNIPSTIEAENAELLNGAGINTDHTGFSGAGFVDKYSAVGPRTLFRVNAAQQGVYNFKLYYANAMNNSSLSIYVNGLKLKQTTLPVLANWDTWGTKAESIALNKGVNTVEYVYEATDGGNVNLDKVVVTLETATSLESELTNSAIVAYPDPFNSLIQLPTVQTWVLTNMLGETVLQGVSIQIETSELAKGIYLLTFSNGRVQRMIKL